MNRPLMSEPGERLMALRKRLIERNVQAEEATALACALLNDQALAELVSEVHRLVELLSAGKPPQGSSGR
jgi:hypothetical protein